MKKREIFQSFFFFYCFEFNYIKTNSDKSHMLFLRNDSVNANIDNDAVTFERKMNY